MSNDDAAPRLADVSLVGRQMVDRMVRQARAAAVPTFRTRLRDHLGGGVDGLPVVGETWPAYEHVNVQRALDAWLAEPGREHEVIGVAGYRHRGDFGFADLLAEHEMMGLRPGNVTRVSLAAGPGGATQDCLRAAVLLLRDHGGPAAILLREPDRNSDMEGLSLEVMATDAAHARRIADDLRRLGHELNVYRGNVVSFGGSVFGERSSFLRFHERPAISADDVILPPATFDDVRRQVVGVARHRDRLRAAGQHLKRGVLLYGPPGVGKTHTVRYLLSELTDTTVVELTGDTLRAIRQACSIARSLQPSMIVVEDVDLIAEQRDHYGGDTPLLFTLLNEMDGLDDDADVVFLLTTNRADLLEPALAQRPGRVDQAVHIDLPDRAARRRLVELYRGTMQVDPDGIEAALERTDGVTASFLKELLRRAAVRASDDTPADADRLVISADDLAAALDDLLDTRNQMTRAVLGWDGEVTPPR